MSIETERNPWMSAPPESEDEQEQVEHLRKDHLLLDPVGMEAMNQDALGSMTRHGRWTWMLIVVLGGLAMMAGVGWLVQLFVGLGFTGLNRTIFWGMYIINLVYFIGIGHAGTFISAAFRVMGFETRRPIARAAETVTLFALAAAGLFPIIHLGRPWKVYWMIPIPNQRQLWPNFQSALEWDAMAIMTYVVGSVLFIYIGLLPDLAMARERTGVNWRRRLYSALSLGWRGTDRQWALHESVSTIFAYVIIPVMFSVHTIVSWDFAMTIQPGWHSTIFGPFFIVGALYSGVAAVLVAMGFLRRFLKLGYFIREEHFDVMAKFLLIMSFAWIYFYFGEFLVTWYGNLPPEMTILDLLLYGEAAPLWWLMIFCNVVVPVGLLWMRRVRRNPGILFVIAVFIQVGMYLERYLIVGVMLGRPELPFNYSWYYPGLEIPIAIGAFSFVIFFYFIFTVFVPIISTWEVGEGQFLHGLRKIGRKITKFKSDMH
ncbi:MAG: polysulfide reductase NrfD [Anaerolineae bacterium]|nr:polysulfide reductase NrfD [Anaerolineae bacterium]